MARGKKCTLKMEVNGEWKEFTYDSVSEARQAITDYKKRSGDPRKIKLVS
jgi:hypothetical protein